MGFYYHNFFSSVLLGIAYVVLLLIYWGAVRVTRGLPKRWMVLSVIAAIFMVLPIGEELWVAWNFGQACKEAGTFIRRKVQTDGFYDATMRSAYENTKPGYFRFVEQPTEDGRGVERIERVDDEFRSQALAWYTARNPDKSVPKTVIYPVNDRVQIVVSMSGPETWKVSKLENATARYHFRRSDPMNGTPWGRDIVRSGTVVIDSEGNQEVARYVSFARGPSWFYIGLDTPGFGCDAPGRWPFKKSSSLIYREVLVPVAQK